MLIAHLLAQAKTDSIFGVVSPPPGVERFNAAAPGGIGLILFVNNMIKVITIGAGLFGLFNVIAAGYTYLGSSGNPKAAEQAGQQILLSFVGLAIIVGAFTITAIVSLLLFGDASYILNPKLPTAG